MNSVESTRKTEIRPARRLLALLAGFLLIWSAAAGELEDIEDIEDIDLSSSGGGAGGHRGY